MKQVNTTSMAVVASIAPKSHNSFPHLNLQINYLATASLEPNPKNPRKHSDRQIHKIAESLQEFGFVNPILIDEDNVIICGNGRFNAAKNLNINYIPTIRLSQLTEAQKKAYIIADNRLAELAEWDKELLKIELGELAALEFESEFDLEITGFETAEIDIILSDEGDPQNETEIVESPNHESTTITKMGDLWLLGEHKLLCGDSRTDTAFNALMGNEKAHMVFTDPPYNVKIDGHVGGSGQIKHREFSMASGEMSENEFLNFLSITTSYITDFTLDGAILYICMDWRHIDQLLAAGKVCELDLKNICVWVKNNGGMGSFYRSQHELIAVFKMGNAPHINNIQLGKHGRYRTNVWEYAGVNTFRKGRMDELAMHPTVKPCPMVMDAIKDASKRGDIILDPFGGSGTTLIAAEKTGRRARLIEYDSHYCDITIKRWQKLTGLEAIKAEDNIPFNTLVMEGSNDE